MLLFGLGGTTYGMWEETMAFFPLLLPIFLAAGYDAVVGVAVILLGAGAGVIASTVNPFATGIAAGFAGVSLGEGLLWRLIQFVIFEGAAIWYVSAMPPCNSSYHSLKRSINNPYQLSFLELRNFI